MVWIVIAARAKTTARRQLAEALTRWFSIDEDTFGTWYDTVRGPTALIADEDDDDGDDDV